MGLTSKQKMKDVLPKVSTEKIYVLAHTYMKCNGYIN